MSTKRAKCSGCGRRIPSTEPDLVLQKHGSTKVRYYHYRCLDAAQRLVMSDPAVWHLTNRYVDAEAN